MEFDYLKSFIDLGYSIYEISKKTKLSPGTVRYWIKKHSLKTKNTIKNEKGYQGKYHCPSCNSTKPLEQFYKRNDGRPMGWCIECSKQSSIERQKENKVKAVNLLGGKCSMCCYDKCITALEFHHPDPKEKDPGYKSIKNKSWEKYWKEISKCILVCANCHREIHFEK